MKRRESIFLPPVRVIALIVMLALFTGLMFSAILGDAVAGFAVGAVFAGAFYLFVVVNARQSAAKLKKRRR